MIETFAIMSSKFRRIALPALAALCGLVMLIVTPAVAAGGAQSGERNSYVLLSQGSQSSTMSGSMDDLSRARALRRGREGLLYVRQGGVAYVIRDAATLRRAEEIFEPQQAMGARQGELGARQGALGSRQGALGAEQARLGARQASASPSRADALSRQQSELGRQQAELGRQQAELGRQQSALGREQDRLAREAQVRLRALVADAIQRGVAQRLN